jgi:hypothetical protein
MFPISSRSFRFHVLILVLLALFGTPCRAQGLDSLPTPAEALLPEVMGPMEKVMWGREGLMRNFGYPLTEASREREMGLRRGLLTAHQLGGFLTLAAMAGTVVTGQLLINSADEAEGAHAGHGGGGEHDHGLHTAKVALAWSTVGLYATTAMLSLMAPPPGHRKARNGWDSISWHKALGVAHFTGMFVTPFLGLAIDDNHDAQIFHQVTGYTTLAALAGAMLVVTF